MIEYSPLGLFVCQCHFLSEDTVQHGDALHHVALLFHSYLPIFQESLSTCFPRQLLMRLRAGSDVVGTWPGHVLLLLEAADIEL